jgi:DNA-binding PadR family transcriptional regulator
MRISGLTFDSSDPVAPAEFHERRLGRPTVKRGPTEATETAGDIATACIRTPSLDDISNHDIVRLVGHDDPTSYLPLPQAQFHVLVALTDGERHGYAIMQAVEESSGGVVRMGPATLYGTLKRLVDHGLAQELARRPDGTDDARRRYYRLTGLGKQVCAAEADRLAHLARIARRNLGPGLA